MTAQEKLLAVRAKLQNAEIAAWYKHEHGLTVDMLTIESVVTYGLTGHGTLADMILDEKE